MLFRVFSLSYYVFYSLVNVSHSVDKAEKFTKDFSGFSTERPPSGNLLNPQQTETFRPLDGVHRGGCGMGTHDGPRRTTCCGVYDSLRLKFTGRMSSACKVSSSQPACGSEGHQLDPLLSLPEMRCNPTPTVLDHVDTRLQGCPNP